MEPPIELAADPRSVREARRLVGEQIRALGGDDDAQDAAALLTSEVVSNAILHARTRVRLSVVERDDRVRIEIWDGSPALPAQRRYGDDSATGRGLRLVATLAAAWGVDPAPDGKTVWFELPLQTAAGAADASALLWLAEG